MFTHEDYYWESTQMPLNSLAAGYTGSYDFEEQDAKTFAEWGIDYLKYDYCHAPSDSAVAHKRYKKMGDALQNSGRKMALGICEWGQLNPEKWARQLVVRFGASAMTYVTCGKTSSNKVVWES